MDHENFFARFRGQERIKRFESVMVFIGIAGPFATLPQLTKLYFTHSQHAPGQSLVTWGLYAVLSLLWFAYGLVEKKPAIYLGNGISVLMNSLMVIGIMVHAGFTL
jgi:uncharacterized protein with PQ loop repeat